MDIYSEVGILDYIVILFSTFQRTSIPLSKTVVPFYILTNSAYSQTFYAFLLMLAIPMVGYCGFEVYVLMTGDAEHCCICLWGIYLLWKMSI